MKAGQILAILAVVAAPSASLAEEAKVKTNKPAGENLYISSQGQNTYDETEPPATSGSMKTEEGKPAPKARN
ncbi:MAG: hypothetical protein AAF724_10440 [Pseudomonadota bacterium]